MIFAVVRMVNGATCTGSAVFIISKALSLLFEDVFNDIIQLQQ